MGICSSCDASNVATTKLILLDGRLLEFPYPVKASDVLAGDPTCFICNADELDFDKAVSAIEEDEELQLGVMYFALPVSKMKSRLQAEDMAALVFKASSALMKHCVGDRSCRCRKKVLDFPVTVRDRGRAEVGGEEDGGCYQHRREGAEAEV